jgi:hypothetical protein
MVITISTPAVACAGVAATDAPRCANGRVFSLVRFQTVRSWPASMSRVAMGVPISPRPTNASFAMGVASFSHAFRTRAPHGRRDGQDRVDLLKVGRGRGQGVARDLSSQGLHGQGRARHLADITSQRCTAAGQVSSRSAAIPGARSPESRNTRYPATPARQYSAGA